MLAFSPALEILVREESIISTVSRKKVTEVPSRDLIFPDENLSQFFFHFKVNFREWISFKLLKGTIFTKYEKK